MITRKMKTEALPPTVKKRSEEVDRYKTMRPFCTPRVKFWKFHLYREPFSLGFNFDDDEDTGWHKWERHMKELVPFQYFVRHEIPFWVSLYWSRLRDLKYAIKYFFFPQNVLKIKTLSRSWKDERTLIPHAVFHILDRFFAGNPESIVDYTASEYDKEFIKAMKDAHVWWHQRDEREATEKRLMDEAWEKKKKNPHATYKEIYGEYDAFLEKCSAEELFHLTNIMKYREGMWT